MNDFSEIQHGLSCLQMAWNTESGESLRTWIDDLWPQMSKELERLFDGHAFNIQNRTFITSLSEHDDDEDIFGRLSMWRAYGGRSGVAVVLNPTIFSSETDKMAVSSAPVLYQTPDEFTKWFTQWVRNLEENTEILRSLNFEDAKGWMFHCFRMFCLCIKHPGFREEKEWRVFHTPEIDGLSKWVNSKIEVIGGLPQEIVELSLEDDVKLEVVGVAPNSLIERVIIGPCESPMTLHFALLSALKDAGVSEPEKRISASLIPLRS
ncbi:DUF2971 domain-containing protein [Novosphingobium sp.]|uniref:DUF2971 domain-containing protein n=1 Tax=Novosphingobium sp. TaxID=1874826 RepID=UPI00286C24F5|nr:DUF2971 domain-containing protein [Novosphingobium sp.]